MLKKVEMNYGPNLYTYIPSDKVDVLKNIIYALYELYCEGYFSLIMNIKRDDLIHLYFRALENNPDNLINYYKALIVKQETKGVKT